MYKGKRFNNDNNKKLSKKKETRTSNEIKNDKESVVQNEIDRVHEANDIMNVVHISDKNDELVKLNKRVYSKAELEEMIEVIKNDIREESQKEKKRKKHIKTKKHIKQQKHIKKSKHEKGLDNKVIKEKNYNKEEKHNIRTTKKKSDSKLKKLIVTIIEIILIGAMLFSGYKITIWYKDNKDNKSIKDELENVVIQTNSNEEGDNSLKAKNFDINFYKLQQTNKDVVAWVKVNNTEIEYPIVKTTDNDFYLDHNLNKNINGAGWVFADYRNNFDGTDKNIILYGHNRKDGSMFGTLKYSQTEQWYSNKDNKNIVLITPDGKYDYEVFSAYTILNEDYYIKTKFSENEFGKFVNKLKSRSVYDFGVEVGESDQILTFSTCSGENYRTVLHAKKVVE